MTLLTRDRANREKRMLKPKEVVQQFGLAAWATPEEIDAFVANCGQVAPGDLQKLIGPLIEKMTVADATRHPKRCRAFESLLEANPNAELFTPLARALRMADPRFRAVIVRMLPKVNSPGRHGELTQVLSAPETEVRRAAAEVLRQVFGPSALKSLAELAADKAFPGRLEAMDIVAQKAAHHAIPLYVSVLKAGSPKERLSALERLADEKLMAKDTDGARNAIAVALDDTDPEVLSRAIVLLPVYATEEQFFAALGSKLETPNLSLLKSLITALRRYGGNRVIDFLTRKFREGPNSIRMAVMDAVEGIANEEVLPLLLEALANNRIELRMRAAEVLSNLGTSGAVDVARVIVWLLRSRDTNIRRMAVEVAKNVGDKSGELAPRLLRHLRDEDWWVRERVMDALVEMAGPTLAKHLASFLQDPSDVVRRFAIGGLIRLKDPRTAGLLVRTALEDTDWWVREQAITAIGLLGDPKTMPYLFEVLKRHPNERLVCFEALARLGVADAGPRIVSFLQDEEPDIRLAVVDALDKLDTRGAAGQVRTLERDPDFRVRSAAQGLLARWAVLEQVSQVWGSEALDVLDGFLVKMAEMGADDLIIAPGRTPYIKHLNKVIPLADAELTPEQTRAILFAHLTPVQVASLAKMQDVDLSYEVKTHGLRFRGHILNERRGVGAVFRSVKSDIPDIEKLALPPVIKSFASLKNGLVLVGGPTGSGKSTTLAALIDYMNRTMNHHILTVEDPIEVVHQRKKSLINQREVGTHTVSFASALRATLREDPDVILVGEMRDLITIQFAVSAAETGHLVFGTLHTVSADTSVDRLINAFPANQQAQIRSMLSDTLRGVVCQHLLRHPSGKGRTLAVEVMLNNEAVSSLIRKGKTFQIPTVITTGRDLGMQSMDSELIRLVREGLATKEEAYMKANDKKAFETAFADELQPPPPKPGAAAAQNGTKTGRVQGGA